MKVRLEKEAERLDNDRLREVLKQIKTLVLRF